MGHLLNMAIKMQDPTTTTTTTTSGVITVNWSFSTATCTGDSFSITKNAATVVGPISASGSGSFTCVVGDALVVNTTSGIKGVACSDAYSEILRNAVVVASSTQFGFSVTATASWTVTAGTTTIVCNGFVGAV